MSSTSPSLVDGAYESLSQALAEAWFRYTTVWLLPGTHVWTVPSSRNPALPQEFPHRVITVKTLLCSEVTSIACTDERATIQLSSESPTFLVDFSLSLRNVNIQGDFPLKSGCGECVYCPTTQGNTNQVAEQSLCDVYASTAVISVRPAAQLYLTDVSFLNIRHQPKAIIASVCGHISLERVSFSNVMAAKRGVLGGVIELSAEGSDPCGSLLYRNGTVELLNNGYEVGGEWDFSAFVRVDRVNSVYFEGLIFHLNLASALIYAVNSGDMRILNCSFDTNLVDISTISIQATDLGTPSTISISNSSFEKGFSHQFSALLISLTGLSGSISLLNCSFSDMFSEKEGAVLISTDKSGSNLTILDLNFNRCIGKSLLTIENIDTLNISGLSADNSGNISQESDGVLSYINNSLTYASILPINLLPSPCLFFLALHSTTTITIFQANFTRGICQSPGFTFTGNSSVTIRNCSFSDNTGNGLITAEVYSDLVIDSVLFTRNTYNDSYKPVGIELNGANPSTVFLSNVDFMENVGYSATFLVAKNITNLVIMSANLAGNTAVVQSAGLLFFPPSSQASFFLIKNSRFFTNSALANGVISIYNPVSTPSSADSCVTFQVLNCSFSHNRATYGGSSVSLIDGVCLSPDSYLRNITSGNNSCEEGGASIYAELALGTLSVIDSNFTGNTGKRGAVISNEYINVKPNLAIVKIQHSQFIENEGDSVISAEGFMQASLQTMSSLFKRNRGSAVSLSNCKWTDSGSVFLNNSSPQGSAASLQSSIAQLTDSQYIGNAAVLIGGGMFISATSTVTCSNCTFRKNKSELVGGAIYIDQNSTFFGTNITCSFNSVGQIGACVYAYRSKVTFVMGVLSDNNSGKYGAIYMSAALLNLTKIDITRNTVKARSPGIGATLSTLVLIDCYCHDQVGVAGSCAFFNDQCYSTLTNFTARNATAGSGGALVILALSDMTMTDSTITDCKATTDGGFIALRISILRAYRVIVNNIKSPLDFGSVFLLQSSLISENTTFRNLTGSAVYGFISNVTATNTTFMNIVTQAGAGISCAECPVVNASQSLFKDNLAKKGGAINSFTSGTAVSILVANLFGNIFMNNKAVNGGAIYFDGIFVTMTDNVFRDNSANSGYYSALEIRRKGLGGAAFSVCNSLPFCNFTYLRNSFINNSAENSGGGLYWASSYPILINNSMEMNSAIYGDDVASFPVRLAALTDDLNIAPYLNESTEPLVYELNDVASGQEFGGKVRVALVDQYDNIVQNDYASSARLTSTNESSVSASGNTEVVAVQGVFEFSNFTLTGPPKTIQTIFITSKGVDENQKTLTQDPTPYYSTVSISLSFRDCITGESLQGVMCYPCPENTFSLNPQDSCTTCPSEANCLGTYIMTPKPGYWRPDPMQNLFFACDNEYACLGSPEGHELSMTGVCEEGYHGNLCSSCDQEYSSQGNGKCGKCPSLKSNIVLLTGLGLLVLFLFALSVYISIRGATRPRSELAIYFKILLNYLQIVTLASSLNLGWPDFVLLFLRGQEVAGNAADQMLSIECLLKSISTAEVFYTNLAVYVILPAGMFILVLVYWSVAKVLTSTQDIPSKLIASFVLAIFILHTSLTKVLFSAFACRELLPGEFWLSSDLSIRCWQGDHVKNILTIALPGILVWIIGLPTLCLLILVRIKRLLNDLKTKIKYSFLYKGYTATFYFWEFCILYRKILVVCVSVFLTTVSLSLQALTMLAVILISLFAQQYFNPFSTRNFNILEVRSLFASLLTLYGGLYFHSNSLSNFHSDLALEILLFAAILLVDAVFALTWISFVGPALLSSIREKLSAIAKRYRVQPATTNKSDMDNTSKISALEEIIPEHRPDTFEVPHNTSMLIEADSSMPNLDIQRNPSGEAKSQWRMQS